MPEETEAAVSETETGSDAQTSPNAEPSSPAATEPASSQNAATPVDDDGAKWKAMSKKNEAAYKAAMKELEQLKKSAMTESEKALAEAEAKGRNAATAEFGKQLAQAKFDAALAAKGIQLGDVSDFIDPARFLNEDGSVDTDAINKAVGKFAKFATPKTPEPPKPPSVSGGEFNGGPGEGKPITEAQLASMTSDQIAKAYNDGKLSHLV